MKVNNQTAVIIGGTGDAGRIPHSDDVFDNLPAIAGRKPITLAEFAKKHADKFRY